MTRETDLIIKQVIDGAIKTRVYPVPVATIEGEIMSVQNQIDDLKTNRVERPSTKAEYLALIDQLEAQHNDLISQNNQIIESNRVAAEAAAISFKTEVDLLIQSPPVRWMVIRAERNTLLQESDWTQVSDTPLSKVVCDSWKVYRQQLRDIPQTFVNPDDVVWPEVPK
jgi:hypothetical protein